MSSIFRGLVDHQETPGVTRQITVRELFELVWQRPMVHLAREFSISNTTLSKVCKQNGIPTPDAGYWTKVEFGLQSEIPTLQMSPLELSAKLDLPIGYPMGEQAKTTKRDRSEVAKFLAPPLVDADFTDAHPIVAKWLRDENLDTIDVAEPTKSASTNRKLSEYDSFRLRVTSTFLKSVETGGAEVVKADLNGRIDLKLGGADLVVIIRQKMSEYCREGIDLKGWTNWPEHHGYWLYPTKDLKLSLRGNCIRPIEFSGSQKQVARHGLKRMIVCVLASKLAKNRQENERIKAETRLKEITARQRERQTRQLEDAERWKRFKFEADQWEHSKKLVSFINHLRKHTNDADMPEVGGKTFHQWLDWAQKNAEKIDPTTRLGSLFVTEPE